MKATIEQKEEFNQLIYDRNIPGFKKFIEDNIEFFPNGVPTKLITMSDDRLLSIMEIWTAVKPEFGEMNRLSRDQIRTKDLESNLSLSSADLVDFIKEKGNYPSCVECEWFRSIPQDEEKACMHLGAMPFDVCCPGWTKLYDVPGTDTTSS
jgi:hypothetical protein